MGKFRSGTGRDFAHLCKKTQRCLNLQYEQECRQTCKPGYGNKRDGDKAQSTFVCSKDGSLVGDMECQTLNCNGAPPEL